MNRSVKMSGSSVIFYEIIVKQSKIIKVDIAKTTNETDQKCYSFFSNCINEITAQQILKIKYIQNKINKTIISSLKIFETFRERKYDIESVKKTATRAKLERTLRSDFAKVFGLIKK